MAIGNLKIHAFKGNTYIPLENAKVTVIQDKENSNKQDLQNLSTDSVGATNEIELEAPLLEYSLKPSNKAPYSLCKIMVEATGYKKLILNGCQIYPGVTIIQDCYLTPLGTRRGDDEVIDISANTLFGDYPSKIPEFEMPTQFITEYGESYYIPPSEQKIPRSLVVHDGHPNDSNAPNYTVYYKEYIKKVIASEIYPTWDIEAIKANAYAIISFTLNRIFTEWYHGKGKKFNIANSTATDHKYNRGIGTTPQINSVVNELFSTYIKKSNYEFPLLSQYTDGKKVPHRNGWMTQWGSEELALKGKTAAEILNHFYGSDITLFKLDIISGTVSSYPGYSLQMGSKGEPVKVIQKSLNTIAKNYPLIPQVIVNGVFGEETKRAVETFQGIFSLAKTGIVNYSNWYKISDIYVALVRGERSNVRLIERRFIPPCMNRCIYFYDEE